MADQNDYVPRGDHEFDDWQDNILPYIAANLVAWGIPQAAYDAAQALQQPWLDAWAVAKNPPNRTSADVQAKDDARQAYESALRDIIQQYIAKNPAVTNQQREEMDITVPDTTRTPAPVPDHAPMASVTKIEHLQHTLRSTDPQQPASRKKPKGVKRTLIFRAFGEEAPTEESSYEYFGSATRFTRRVQFTQSQVGQRCWYILKYENARGETGPSTAAFSAVVA